MGFISNNESFSCCSFVFLKSPVLLMTNALNEKKTIITQRSLTDTRAREDSPVNVCVRVCVCVQLIFRSRTMGAPCGGSSAFSASPLIVTAPLTVSPLSLVCLGCG